LHFTEDTYTSDGLVAINDRLVDAQQMKMQMNSINPKKAKFNKELVWIYNQRNPNAVPSMK